MGRPRKQQRTSDTKAKREHDEEERDEQEEQEEEYEVEAILAHRRREKKTQYLIKWRGYSDDDNTWEDSDNVFCLDLVSAYWKTRDAQAASPFKHDASHKHAARSPTPPPRHKRARVINTEEYVDKAPTADPDDFADKLYKIDTVERCDDGKLIVYIRLKNGRQCVVDSDYAYKAFPQQMLKFYEERLRFKPTSDDSDS